MPRTYLKVPFPQKDAAKSLGAKWDATVGSWYVPENVGVAPFAAWLAGSLPAVVAASDTATSTALTARARAGAALAVDKQGVPLSRFLAVARRRRQRSRCSLQGWRLDYGGSHRRQRSGRPRLP